MVHHSITQHSALRSFLHACHTLWWKRVDAWGIAFVMVSLALIIHQQVFWKSLWLLTAITVGYWLAYVLNDYFDAEYDAHDKDKAKQNFFVQYDVSSNLLLFILGLCLTYLVVSFVYFGLEGFILLIICFFVMWSYTAPPIRFKSRPVLDLAIHGIFVQTFPYLIALLLLNCIWLSADYVLLAMGLLASVTGQLNQQIRDYEVDSQTDRNFTTTFGVKTSSVLLKIVVVLLFALMTISTLVGAIPLYVVPYCLLALPIFLGRLRRQQDSPATHSRRLVYITMSVVLLYTIVLLVLTAI